MHRLRAVVKRTLLDATERVYLGWRLIGHNDYVAHGKHNVYAGFIAPLQDSVRLGFERGGGTQVRYVKGLSPDDIDDDALAALVVERKREALAKRLNSPFQALLTVA